MWTNEVSSERLAQIFHHYHRALNPSPTTAESPFHGIEGRSSWTEIPQREKNRLVATARLVLLELRSNEPEEQLPRQYFAKPGEAEWGC
jgi:hypothetical protein